VVETLPDYFRIQYVSSFQELVSTPFADGINALCWQRRLPGDYAEVVSLLQTEEGITALDEDDLISLPVSPEGKKAVQTLLADLQMLRAHELAPELDCIRGYVRDDPPEPVPTHVYSYHADSATVKADTYLCTYHGASSQALKNEDALCCVDLPETRALLLSLYGGGDDAGFREWLAEHCYDLHYEALPGAQPYELGVGNLWRIALQYPGSPVPPCIHRAPETLPGDVTRLLLLS
jgi:hypothetical protein